MKYLLLFVEKKREKQFNAKNKTRQNKTTTESTETRQILTES